MKYKNTAGATVFKTFNYVFLSITGLLCLLPFINLLAVSLSSSNAVAAGSVNFIPIEFTLKSYGFVMKSDQILGSFLISVERVIFGVAINMFLMVLAAYALSKDKQTFKSRGIYTWFFLITILFSGGLIPSYVVISKLGLINSMWALLLPGALPVFNMIVLLNFFRGLPKELEESALVEGANHWQILWKIFLPISKPALATVMLFCIVAHWNSWFDGLIFMNRPEKYPLQSYLQTIIMNPEQFLRTTGNDYEMFLSFVNARTTRAAQLFVATFPILAIYPFLQKYFTTGLVLGSVKG